MFLLIFECVTLKMAAHMFPLNNQLNEGMENNSCSSDYASLHKTPVPLTSDYVTKTTNLKLCKVANLFCV